MSISGVGANSFAYSSLYARPAAGPAGSGMASAKADASGQALSQEQQAQVSKLKETDQKVRAHEQAHLAAAGGIAVSGASFQYVQGPDGKRYAVGGEVSIDTSAGKTPEETIRKAENIRRAALAPADPSSQDQAVAAAATQMQLQARLELSRTAAQGEEGQGSVGQGSDRQGRADQRASRPDAGENTGSTESGGLSRRGREAVQAYGATGATGVTGIMGPGNGFSAFA